MKGHSELHTSHADMAEAEALFGHIDLDNNGALSLFELQTHLEDLGFTDADAEQLLFALDTDKDGQVLALEHAGDRSFKSCLVGVQGRVCGWLSSICSTPHRLSLWSIFSTGNGHINCQRNSTPSVSARRSRAR